METQAGINIIEDWAAEKNSECKEQVILIELTKMAKFQ
jgi:hypothetical protein